jgi:hypothetical protein
MGLHAYCPLACSRFVSTQSVHHPSTSYAFRKYMNSNFASWLDRVLYDVTCLLCNGLFETGFNIS